MRATPKSAGKQVAGKKALHPATENFDAMVAEAAYYLAEQRDFAPGREMEDWLAAEGRLRTSHKDA